MAEQVVVSRADFAAGLSAALHRVGLAVSPDRAARFARALELIAPLDRGSLYWTARVSFVSAHTQLPIFDAMFSAVFDGQLDPSDNRGDRGAPPPIGAPPRPSREPDREPRVPSGSATPGIAAARDARGVGDEAREAILAMSSTHERLNRTSFADLDRAELGAVRELIARIVVATPSRRSRRATPVRQRSRRLDLRATVQAAQRCGAEAFELRYGQRRRYPRQLIMLCDVSGSMQSYTQVYLSLLQGAVSSAGAQAFVFSTRLTRLTRQLSTRNPQLALARAAATESGWSSGTRLAESLREFIDHFGRPGMARGAVVVIFSDGWATDEPDQVAAQMARLRRLAFRIVWVNPRKAATGYAPLVGGMAAALPYCDAFVSGHTLAGLRELAAVIAEP